MTVKAMEIKGNARDRLLEAGLDVFGRYGFEPATTRRIAKQAGVNIAAIPYYFNGKEGLYREVVAHVAGNIEALLKGTLGEIRMHLAQADPNCDQALALLLKLMGQVIDFMIGSTQAPRFARILLREHLDPSSAYDIIFDRTMAPLIDAISGLAAVVAQTPFSNTFKLQAISLMGQIMAFRVARETVVRALDAKGYSPEETEAIRRLILAQTEAALRGLGKAGNDQKDDENSDEGWSMPPF